MSHAADGWADCDGDDVDEGAGGNDVVAAYTQIDGSADTRKGLNVSSAADVDVAAAAAAVAVVMSVGAESSPVETCAPVFSLAPQSPPLAAACPKSHWYESRDLDPWGHIRLWERLRFRCWWWTCLLG